MKILVITQIIDSTDPGLGFFHRWIEVFRTECEEVTAVCLKKGMYSFPEYVEVVSLGKEDGVSRLKYLRRFYTTIWKYRKDYDAVFVHMNPEYVVLGGLLWRLMGKTVGLWYSHRTVDLKLRIAERFTNIVFTGSKESFRISSAKVLVTGQGVDTSVFTPRDVRPSVPPTLLVVGRISPIKNLELAIDTLIAVRKSMPNAVLRIVGAVGKPEDQVYLDTITARIRNERLEDAVIMVGGKDPAGVLEELRAADVFLHTSMTNSADKTAVEAMSVGLYQVTSSPVYQKDLPASCSQEATAAAYAGEALRYLALPDTEKYRLATLLREAAIREHSLVRLIRLILRTLADGNV